MRFPNPVFPDFPHRGKKFSMAWKTRPKFFMAWKNQAKVFHGVENSPKNFP